MVLREPSEGHLWGHERENFIPILWATSTLVSISREFTIFDVGNTPIDFPLYLAMFKILSFRPLLAIAGIIAAGCSAPNFLDLPRLIAWPSPYFCSNFVPALSILVLC